MDGGFEFQLGVFSGGFVPDASNINRWAVHWVSAQATPYVTASKSFVSQFTVTGNAVPFGVGAKAYVWGRRSSATGSEWILFRNTGWTWPAPDPMSPLSLDWNAANANEIVLGSIVSGGTPHLMRSAAVFSYNQWREQNLAGETPNSPNGDPDHDGVSNLMEFIFGTSPVVESSPPTTPISFTDVSGQNHLQISIPRLRNRLADLTVEVSGDLVNWNSGNMHATEVSNTTEALVVRDNSVSGPGLPKRFMRLKAVITP